MGKSPLRFRNGCRIDPGGDMATKTIKLRGHGIHPKVEGQVVGQFQGFSVYATVRKAKTPRGKDRVWFQIRQDEKKRWRVAESLSYMRAVDVQFERTDNGVSDDGDSGD
jgi:hypothetical protein